MKKNYYIIAFFFFAFLTQNSFSETGDSLSLYPNPFKNTTTIHFDIAKADTISLIVYNTFGNSSKIFYKNAYLQSGSYSLNFYADTLPDGIYFVSLKLTNNNKPLIKKVLKTVSATSVQNSKNKKNSAIMPNPTRDFVTIPYEGIKQIIVTDLTGRIIKKLRTESKSLSLEEEPTGEYFITILTDKQEFLTTEKIIKVE